MTLKSECLKQRNFCFRSPRRMKLALVLCVGVAVNGDDADRRAGRVGDDDWLTQCGDGAGRGHATAAE